MWLMLKSVNYYLEQQANTNLRSVWTNPLHFVACGFGVGTMPFMPGTFGTLVGVIWYCLIQDCAFFPYLFLSLAVIGLGVFLCARMNEALGTEDHPAAVFDEIAAFPLVMLGLPAHHTGLIILGFILFRWLDIAKPGPIGWCDRSVHGGLGVMLDDVVAALIACGLLHLFFLFFLK